MIKYLPHIMLTILLMNIISCSEKDKMNIQVYETSENGNKLTEVNQFDTQNTTSTIKLNPSEKLQTITGFGGAFTESSAYLLNKLSEEKRQKILDAYFSRQGANYSLTRTHMNSCDFTLRQYSYTPTPDKTLADFSVKEDKDDLIPMIKNALSTSEDGFKILASPWTAPPWMKDNKAWVGGKLLPEYYDAWALFFSKYIDAYNDEGIDIWGFTVENEPHGNGNNWESMHFTPQEMTDFVVNHLGPKLESDGHGDKIILGYDQNREGIKEWVDEMYKDATTSKYYDGTAIHWYESTFMIFPEQLQYAHEKAPNKLLIQTEACVDSEVPAWKNDDWYWQKEATDWGWDWAPDHQKAWHPKYAPAHRYARDIIGCLNNWVDGWIDWNMVLNRQGGPNWFKNWCVAPIIVDEEADEVYLTPLYYIMAHFSKYIRPGAEVIGVENTDESLMVAAAKNPDGTIAVVVFNEDKKTKSFSLEIENHKQIISINPQSIQTIVLSE